MFTNVENTFSLYKYTNNLFFICNGTSVTLGQDAIHALLISNKIRWMCSYLVDLRIWKFHHRDFQEGLVAQEWHFLNMGLELLSSPLTGTPNCFHIWFFFPQWYDLCTRAQKWTTLSDVCFEYIVTSNITLRDLECTHVNCGLYSNWSNNKWFYNATSLYCGK